MASQILNDISDDLFPLQSLLRIQVDGKDVKIIQSSNTLHSYYEDFKSAYSPQQLNILALVSHNEMKPTMKQFVVANKNVLKKFRLTGTKSTMTMLKEVFKDEPSICYGRNNNGAPRLG